MKWVFGGIYVLVLATQLPHVWAAYADLEQPDLPWAHVTAIGAAFAFELATGVFTLRVVQGSRRRWTRVGLTFFIVASAVANAYYYRVWPFVFDWLMPVFATIALPLALALFAEEFGTELNAEEREAELAERREKREERRKEREAERLRLEMERAEQEAEQAEQEAVTWYRCQHPGCNARYTSPQALAGHMNAHSNGREREKALASRNGRE